MKNQQKYILIGFGKAGQLHYDVVNKAANQYGYEVIVVDPAPVPSSIRYFPTIESLPEDFRNAAFAWDICTPTESHVAYVKQILALDPNARVVLEKPLCRSDELAELTAIIEAHSEAQFFVNDLYAYSKVPASILDVMHGYCLEQDVLEVEIEFTKNRVLDMEGGRFCDTDYGVVGYEWFHMLTLLESLLPQEQTEKYFDSWLEYTTLYPTYHDHYGTSSLLEITKIDGLPTIILYSSISGHPRLRQTAGSLADTCDFALPSIERYRTIRLRLAEVEISCRLEPIVDSVGSQLLRNVHTIAVSRHNREVERFTVPDNHLANALGTALETFAGRRRPGSRISQNLRAQARLISLARALNNTEEPIHSYVKA